MKPQWADFKFPPVNLWSLPRQYRDFVGYAAMATTLSGCAVASYTHTLPDGSSRHFYACALGTTSAVKELAWKIGDSDLHVGEVQQQQPLGEIVGEIVGAAVKAAK
jgi:hypothetical protein